MSGCAVLLPVPPCFLGGGWPPRGRAHRGADGALIDVVDVFVLAVIELLAGFLSLIDDLLVDVPLCADRFASEAAGVHIVQLLRDLQILIRSEDSLLRIPADQLRLLGIEVDGNVRDLRDSSLLTPETATDARMASAISAVLRASVPVLCKP